MRKQKLYEKEYLYQVKKTILLFIRK